MCNTFLLVLRPFHLFYSKQPGSQHLRKPSPRWLTLSWCISVSSPLGRHFLVLSNAKAQSSPEQSKMPRVTMPSRDLLGSVDPDNVQVAEVDTLLVHQGGTGTTLGPTGSPGCARSRAVPSILSPGAEFCSQDGCEEKQRVDMGLSLMSRTPAS